MPATAMKNSTTRIAPTIRQALRQPLPDDLAGAGFQGGVPPPAGTWPGGTAAGAAPQPGGGACWTGAWGAGAAGAVRRAARRPAASRAGEPPRAAVPSRSGQEPPVRRAQQGPRPGPIPSGPARQAPRVRARPVAAPARLGTASAGWPQPGMAPGFGGSLDIGSLPVGACWPIGRRAALSMFGGPDSMPSARSVVAGTVGRRRTTIRSRGRVAQRQSKRLIIARSQVRILSLLPPLLPGETVRACSRAADEAPPVERRRNVTKSERAHNRIVVLGARQITVRLVRSERSAHRAGGRPGAILAPTAGSGPVSRTRRRPG